MRSFFFACPLRRRILFDLRRSPLAITSSFGGVLPTARLDLAGPEDFPRKSGEGKNIAGLQENAGDEAQLD